MNGTLIPWKKIAMIAGAIGAVLGVMVTWEKLEFLPRWAWYSEVVVVQEFAQDTRKIVLNQEWFRLKTELREVQIKLDKNPSDRELIRDATRLEQQIRDVEEQLDQLKK